MTRRMAAIDHKFHTTPSLPGDHRYTAGADSSTLEAHTSALGVLSFALEVLSPTLGGPALLGRIALLSNHSPTL